MPGHSHLNHTRAITLSSIYSAFKDLHQSRDDHKIYCVEERDANERTSLENKADYEHV